MTSSKQTKNSDRLLAPSQLYSLRTLLVTGAIVHVASTLTLFIIGRFALAPSWVSATGAIRGDAPGYMTKISRLSGNLWAGDASFLFTFQEQIHLRLYSLSYSALSGISGHNILALEPINLALFLLTLFLVYKIGESLFEPRTGFIAAYVILVFPSLLLHSTQPLRDNLFIPVFLLLIYQFVRAIRSTYSASTALVAAAFGSGTFLLLFFVRDAMFFVYLAIGCLALFSLVAKSVVQDWKYTFNCVVIVTVLATAIFSSMFLYDIRPLKARETVASREKRIQDRGRVVRRSNGRVIRRVNKLRIGFALSNRGAGSDIDSDILFKDTKALALYLPRALLIGLLSPLPNMWFEEGKEFGRTGRLIAGFETLVIYVFVLFAVFLAASERSVSNYFVFSSVLLGTLALGLTVTNVGTIYRLRYGFWILLIVLGVKGFGLAVEKFGPSKTAIREDIEAAH